MFENLELAFSPGINVFIGENATGKTHILKVLYAASDVSVSGRSLADKLLKVFLPTENKIGRLARRTGKIRRAYSNEQASVEVQRNCPGSNESLKLELAFSADAIMAATTKASSGAQQWAEFPVKSVYIPVKDMMANAPGFRSLYALRQIHFEEVYADVIDRVFLAGLRDLDSRLKSLLLNLQREMHGKVVTRKEEFFLETGKGEFEFTMVAEGLRKLSLLWLLIQNGTLSGGSVLFWDEPETNLNPKMLKTVVEVLFALQRLGVQIFIATHNYVVLKEFALQAETSDELKFFSLYRHPKSDSVVAQDFTDFDEIQPNAIDDAFADIIDRELVAKLRGGKR